MVTVTLPADKIPMYALSFYEKVARADVEKVAASRYLELLRRHFRSAVAPRHGTAQRLNAVPTGYWSNPTTYTQLQGNEITITKPGIARALGPVTIRPTQAKALTLPIAALAYGKRVADLRHTLGKPIFRPKGTRLLAYQEDDGTLKPLYALVGKVTQPQDATLLPPEETVHTALQDALKITLAALAQNI